MVKLKLHLDADTSQKSLHKALLDRRHDVTRTPNDWMPLDASDEVQLKGLTEFQADLSYNFETGKDISDLCIEVMGYKSNVTKLRRYQLLAVPEVWFWEEGKISIYCLQDGDYVEMQGSLGLPDLDIEHLEQCLLMDSQLDAMLTFSDRYKIKA